MNDSDIIKELARKLNEKRQMEYDHSGIYMTAGQEYKNPLFECYKDFPEDVKERMLAIYKIAY